ncbi:hypothetical protein NUU61_002538 [Penicillium alfredii]|uniref:DSBA-like thioredoxin domain-containing protein n=1 Tax=Penicillium alfredii TaxID=1506179 RepID=A0A9W9FRN6_9EURO|nr:uncharacterized protein NUU61_002538 [Penicillium alfredii]KAJ5105191.1 hypothetical protein NUU61_002538 [Penicillium alfredii]
MTNFKIQIISDNVCPWCYVGYRRLTRAITAHKTTHPTDTFTLHWQAFYLNPTAPGYPGINKQEMYRAKFGAARMAAMFSRLSAAGDGDGIAFRFGGNTGSTRDSHRLVWYAGQEEARMTAAADETAQPLSTATTTTAVGGLQTRVVENLFRAYFEQERNITDREVLADAAAGAGLDCEAVRKWLESDAGGPEVDLEAESASRRLVTGVPYFLVQDKYSVEGADEPEGFLEVFERVKRDE